jgi:hypothetical protein
MRRTRATRWLVLAALGAAVALAVAAAASGFDSGGNPGTTGPATITWTGNGANQAAGTIDNSQCDANNTPYLLWILTPGGNDTIQNDATTPTLTLSGTGSGSYNTSNPSDNSAAHFVTPFYTPDSSLIANVSMNVTNADNTHASWILTISHGCAGSTTPPCTDNCSTNASADLNVFSDANASDTLTYGWNIQKSVDKSHTDGSATFTYTVSVSHDSGTLGGWAVSGDIFVTNPNQDAVNGVVVTDAIDDANATCVVSNGSPDNADPSGGTISGLTTEDYAYSCTYSAAPANSSQTNTATVTYPSQNLPDDGPLTGNTLPTPVGVDWSTVDPSIVDGSVDVTDPLGGGDLGNVDINGSNPTTFTYSTYVAATNDKCTTVPNTATFTTNDLGLTGSDSKSVTVCGLVTGGLTMGFWQNKNGQALITGANQTTLKAYLLTFAPFQDFTSGTVANYVTKVLKAANASGAAMNAMLKGQMLATALDVKLAGLNGSENVDLTNVWNTGENTSSAFGGSCLTVNGLLAAASTASNSGGSVWYGQNKATQQLAKDTFDAINNGVVFTC